MTQKERKLEVAKVNRETIIVSISSILKEEKSYMTLKTAMEIFLSVNVKDPENFLIPTGLQKVRKAAERATRRDSYNPFISDAARRQMPSSMR